MAYKAFQDFYKEADIKHLLLLEHNGKLISPPFATDNCKEYSKIMIIDDDISYIELDVPPATSKFNAFAKIKDSTWFIPYGIWDDFNVVVQLKEFEPIYHSIKFPGKGQFYSIATNNETAFSFPLGYEGTEYGLFIEHDTVKTIPFDTDGHIKLHMGCVYCNGRYWSAPRSDTPGYIDFVSFDGDKIKKYPIHVNRPEVTRKYTDIIVKGNILYSLPFGGQPGINEVIEFNTDDNTYKLHTLNVPDFAKKFNCMVEIDNCIIGLPYGSKEYNDSHWGISFNTVTKESKCFDIGSDLSFGGKYRYRCGINYNNKAVFLPSGTPTCPIISVDQNLELQYVYIENTMLGRPIIHDTKLKVLGYNVVNKTLTLFTFNDDLSYSGRLL